jgi:hypothetical protein
LQVQKISLYQLEMPFKQLKVFTALPNLQVQKINLQVQKISLYQLEMPFEQLIMNVILVDVHFVNVTYFTFQIG